MPSDVYVKDRLSQEILDLIKLGYMPDGTYIGFSQEDFSETGRKRIVVEDMYEIHYKAIEPVRLDIYYELIEDDGYDEY